MPLATSGGLCYTGLMPAAVALRLNLWGSYEVCRGNASIIAIVYSFVEPLLKLGGEKFCPVEFTFYLVA